MCLHIHIHNTINIYYTCEGGYYHGQLQFPPGNAQLTWCCIRGLEQAAAADVVVEDDEKNNDDDGGGDDDDDTGLL
jgi:hypothetical protein